MTTAELFKDIQLLVLDVDGVMTDGRAWQDERGRWRHVFSVRDSIGIRALMKAGVRVAIVHEHESEIVRKHVQQLGVTDYSENCKDKSAAVLNFVNELGLALAHVAFVSESVADAALLKQMRCGITVDGADVALRLSAHFVCSHRGGDGAVLEVCNLIMKESGRLRGSERNRNKIGNQDSAL